MPQMIKEFQKLYRPLSNFWSIQIEYEGLMFYSTEAAYQAMKCANSEDRLLFTSLTASQAKNKSKEFEIGKLNKRTNWHDVNLQIMYNLNKQKFSSGYLRELLLSTDEEELQEGNTWGDTFWGVDLASQIGENHLGKILMRVRSELRAEETSKLAQ